MADHVDLTVGLTPKIKECVDTAIAEDVASLVGLLDVYRRALVLMVVTGGRCGAVSTWETGNRKTCPELPGHTHRGHFWAGTTLLIPSPWNADPEAAALVAELRAET